MDTLMDELHTEYNLLKSNVSALEMDLESKNQLIYDFKSKIAVATALEGDYQQEIDLMRCNDDTEVSELRRKVKELEDGIINFRQSSNLELLRKTELIESLQNELKELSKNNASNDEYKESESDRIDIEFERNSTLKEEVNILTNTLVELQTSIDNLQMQNSNLEETNNNFLVELDHAKQNFTYKMQELTETKNLIHSLQEDSFLIKLELESMKNKPLDVAKKGNSLFAEVEDSRIKTQQNIQQLKKKYAELKRDVCNKLKQMTSIRGRNTELSDQLNFIKSYDEEYEKIIEAYKIRVAALESAIEEYKKEVLKEQTFSGKDLPSYSVEFANVALRTKWNDREKARNELNRESKKKLETFINIKEANTEMREWRRKAQQLKIKIEKLENTVLEMELQSSPTSLESLENFPEQNVVRSSTSNCSENKPTLTIEDILKRNTIEIRKKSNVHGKQNKSLALDSELKIEMFRCKSLDLGAESTEIKIESEPASHYPQIKHNVLNIRKENNTEDENNISGQVEQIDNNTVSEILKSKSFEAKLELEMVESNTDEDSVVQTTIESKIDQSVIEQQDEHDKSVIIVENVYHDISAESTLQNMSLARSLKMEFDEGEQSKTLILDNVSASEILNSTSFEAKIELIEPKIERIDPTMFETNAKAETKNGNNIDQTATEYQDDQDDSVIIVENTSGIELLNSTSCNISAEPPKLKMQDLSSSLKMQSNIGDQRIEYAIKKPKSPTLQDQVFKLSSLNEGVACHLQSTVEFSSNIINITDDEKESSNEKYETETFELIEFNGYVQQQTPSESNWNNEIIKEPVKESNNEERFFHHTEFKKITYEKSHVAKAGHTPAAHQKFRSKSNSEFVEKINKEISQLNINNAGHTPASHQKWSVKNTPATGAASAKKPLDSGKKTLKSKTGIPIPTRRKLN